MPDILFLTEGFEGDSNPLADNAAYTLDGLLKFVGVRRQECAVASVFPFPVPRIANLCGKKAEGIPGRSMVARPGKYLRKEYASHLDDLNSLLTAQRPNVVVALGATATWALLDTAGIKSVRGAAALGPNNLKVIATYSPEDVMRQWQLRPIVMADLDKAKRESASPILTRPSREIWIEPTLRDLATYEERYINNAERLSIDIETKGDQITCIGFAPDPSSAIVVPFYSENRKGNYWPTLADELKAWTYVRRWCQRPAVFQNGLYDIHFLWRRYGIPVPLARHDTMLLHHALQPEMEKGLGFLGTIYTDEASWKFMRKTDTIKRED